MSNRIITISREFGSGGRTIGKQVAAQLGIRCYDQSLIEKIAQQSGFAKEYVSEQSENAPHSSWFASAFVGRDRNGLTNQDQLWFIQRNVILELVEKGPCVIVGRCADYILRDHDNLLSAFIHASMEDRAERIVTVYGESDQTPQRRLADKDKRRASYYQFYTDITWGQAKNYHISLNSGVLGIDKCAAIIADLY